MSMFDPFERGESLELLREFDTFVLVEAKLRRGVKTEHGTRDAVDLRVATTQEGELRLFSGFWAGIVGQVKRIDKGDLPATVRIVEQPTDKGNPTYTLELVEKPQLPENELERSRMLAMAAHALAKPVPPKPDEFAGEPGSAGAPLDESQAA